MSARSDVSIDAHRCPWTQCARMTTEDGIMAQLLRKCSAVCIYASMILASSHSIEHRKLT
jgi:hypothetical protein